MAIDFAPTVSAESLFRNGVVRPLIPVRHQLRALNRNRDNVLIYSSYYCEQNVKWTLAPHDFFREGEALSEYLFVRQGDIHASNWLGNRALFEKFLSWNAMPGPAISPVCEKS